MWTYSILRDIVLKISKFETWGGFKFQSKARKSQFRRKCIWQITVSCRLLNSLSALVDATGYSAQSMAYIRGYTHSWLIVPRYTFVPDVAKIIEPQTTWEGIHFVAPFSIFFSVSGKEQGEGLLRKTHNGEALLGQANSSGGWTPATPFTTQGFTGPSLHSPGAPSPVDTEHYTCSVGAARKPYYNACVE